MSEHELQSMCFKWFGLQHRKYQGLFFAIPNGGLRNVGVARKLKKEGATAGVCDTFLSMPASDNQGYYHGLYIEFKVGKNKPTEKQKNFIEEVESMGYKTAVIYKIEDFEKLINEYLKEW